MEDYLVFPQAGLSAEEPERFAPAPPDDADLDLSASTPYTPEEPQRPSVSHQPPPVASRKRRPCQPCRFRRVKCDRSPAAAPDSPCIKCQQKGLACLEMPPSAKRAPVNRSGVRIDRAKAVFGGAESPKQDLVGTVVPATTAPDNAQLQPSSVSSQLNLAEIKGSLISSLLDNYLDFTRALPTLVDETQLRSTYEAAGRQARHLDDQSQVLLAVLAAVAARFSDHPLIVGPAAPRITELGQAAIIGIDLSEYGDRREAACAALTQHAIRLVDEKHTMRVATLESISALMLLESLGQTWEPGVSPQIPFTTSYIGHTRTLLEFPDTPDKKVSGSSIGWTAFVRDAMLSARIGRSVSFSEDDLLLLCNGFGIPPPLRVALTAPPTLDPQESYWLLFNSWMMDQARVATAISKRLTGVAARRAIQIDEGCVRESYYDPQGRPESQEIIRNFRTLSIMRCFLCFLIHDTVQKRFHLVEQGTSGKYENLAPDSYPARLLLLAQDTRTPALQAARDMAHFLEVLIHAGVAPGTVEWADWRSLEALFVDIPIWVPLLLESRTAEEGGPSDYTFEVRLNELEWILKAVKSVSWAFAKLGRPAVWLQAEIHALIQKQRSHPGQFAVLDPGILVSDVLDMIGAEGQLPQLVAQAGLQAERATGLCL